MVDRTRGSFPRLEEHKTLYDWARAVVDHQGSFRREQVQVNPEPFLLAHQQQSNLTRISASVDGIIMWNATLECPVISKGGEWVPLPINDFVQAGEFTTTTAAAGDLINFTTPYATPPVVTASCVGIDSGVQNVAYCVSVGSVTATGFRARVSSISTSSVATVAHDISWHAVGDL